MRHIHLALILFFATAACNDSSKNRSPEPSNPPVILPGQDSSQRMPQAPLRPAPLPPLSTGDVQGPPNSIEIGSAEMQFLTAVAGRWRSSCEVFEENGTSRFYGIEITAQGWSTMIFDYFDNDSCIHIAAPNGGLARTYGLSIKAEAEGWFTLKGACLSPDNACQGVNEVRVKLDADHVLHMQKVSGDSLWLNPELDEMVYDF